MRIALSAAALIAWSGCAMAQLYSIEEISTLGGTTSVGVAINSSGEVTGYTGPGALAPNSTQAFFYSSGVTQGLGTFGGDYSQGEGVNDSGQITGRAFFSDNTTYHAFLYSDGVMKDIGTLGGTSSEGTAINASGQITGYAYTANSGSFPFLYSDGSMTNIGPTIEGELGRSINKAGQIVTAGGFFYSNGALTNIGSLGGGDTYVANPSDMNGAGQITGYSAIAGTGNTPTHAFLYSNGVMTDIGPLDGQSTGNAISASGQITGWAYFGGTTPHAFLYSNGVMQDLGTLGGTESHGIGIDAYGQVVGNSATASGVTHAFMYSNGQTVDLNTLIDPNSPLAPYVTLNNASRVTNTGYILANGTDSRTGYFVSFVLTPNPTIPTVTPAIAGTLGENGWYVSATTLSWTITGYPTPTTSGCGTVSVPDTKGKTYTCTATNSSGSASGSVTMKKDTVPPQVTIKIPVKGKTYALNEKVLASYTCLDITSGVAACSGTVKDGAAVNTSTKGTKTFEVIGIDKAGNKTTDFVLYTVK